MIANTFRKLKIILSENDQKKMYIFLFLSLFSMILEILSVGLIIPLLNSLVSNDINLNFLKIFEELTIIQIVITLLIVYSLKAIFLTFFSYLETDFLANVRANLSNILFKLYINRPYDFHLKNNTSKLIRNISETNLLILVMKSLISLTNEFLVMMGISLFIVFFQPKISIFVVFFLGLIGFLFYKIVQKKIKLWGKIRTQTSAKLVKIQNESFRLIKEIKILNRAKNIIDKFIFDNRKIVHSESKHSFTSSLPRLWLEWLVINTFLTSILFMFLSGKNLSEIIVIIGVFTAAAFRIMPSLTRIMNSLHSILYHQTVLDNISGEIKNLGKEKNNILTKSSSTDERLKKDLVHVNNVDVSNLEFYYDKSHKIFDSTSIKLEKGNIYGICGASGIGKSTFINLLLGFLKPTKGKIKFNDINIFENLRTWRDNIGFVPQEIFLFDGSILENILLHISENKIDNHKLESALVNSNLQSFIKNLPEGLNTNIGEFGDKISGGQKQRIGIARAIFNNPKVLILDEFTSSLDIKNEKKILEEISHLKKDKIIIIISHKISTLSHCDRIFKIENQTLVQSN
jgi:ATP-binding cassette, subfamily B, bacterial PglK